MARLDPNMDKFCECSNRGERTQMKITTHQKMLTGEAGEKFCEVVTYTCPCCGFSKTVVDAKGVAVTAADWAEMNSR